VRRQAFSKLEKLVPRDHPIKARARQERFQELAQQAEALAEARLPSAANEIAGLRASWASIEAEGAADSKTTERFDAALEAIAALAPATRAPEAAAIERPDETTEAPAAPEDPDSRAPLFLTLVERLEAFGDGDLPSGLDPLRAEWDEVAAQGPPPSKLQSRFRRLLKSASARLERIQSLEAGAREAAVLVERAETASREPDLPRAVSELRSLEREWSRLADPADPALAERFRAALTHGKTREEEARARQEELEQRNLRDVEARIQLMETLAASENLSIKDADRVLKEAQEFLK
jgi:hypothetical protein